MPNLYTANGDDGFTGFLGEGRLPKHHPRLEAVGSVDEATAALGVARANCQTQLATKILVTVQRDLYHLMAELAAEPENAARFRSIDSSRVVWLAEQIELLGTLAPPPKEFILPGDSPAGAALDLSRAVVRRAERRVALLLHTGEIENQDLLRYLNRLSSLCFALELLENLAHDQEGPTLAKG